MEVEEAAAVQNKVGGFLERQKAHAIANPKPKAKSKTSRVKAQTIPMMSNKLMAQGVDKTLMISTGHGSMGFRACGRHVAPLQQGEARDFVPRAELPDDLCEPEHDCRSFIQIPSEAEDKPELVRNGANELHMISDCGAVGFPMGLWTFTLGLMCGTFTSDVFAHDCHASVKRACLLAGGWLTVLEWSLVANFLKAPFKSHANLESFVSGAQDLFVLIRSLKFNFELWKTFYEPIAKALGLWDSAVAWTIGHMSDVLAACETHPIVHHAGKTVQLSRWFSVWDRFTDKLVETVPLMTMIMVWLGFFKGWLTCGDALLQYVLGTSLHTVVGSTRMAGRADITRTVAESALVLQRLRNDSHCTEHTVLIILSNYLSLRVMTAYSVFVAVTRKLHGQSLHKACKPDRCMELRVDMALGGWRKELQEILEITKSAELLENCTFTPASRLGAMSEEEKQVEVVLTDRVHTFLVHLMGARVIYASKLEYMFPWAAAGLLSQDAGKLKKQMTKFERWWTGLCRLEVEAQTDIEAKRFQMSLLFPLWSWARILLIELKECSFKRVLKTRLDKLTRWARGFITTKVDEDGIKVIKTKSRASDQGATSRANRWGNLVDSELLKEYGHKGLEVTAEDTASALGLELADELFDAAAGTHSLPKEDFDTITDLHGKDHYPKMNAENFHSIGLKWEAYLEAPSFKEFQKGWYTLFLNAGWVLCSKAADGPMTVLGIIVHATRWFALVFPIRIANRRNHIFSWSTTGKFDIIQLRSLSPDYVVIRSTGVGPGDAYIKFGKYMQGITTVGTSMTPLESSAECSFKGLTKDDLEALFEELPLCVGPRPKQERPLVAACARGVLPKASEERIKEISEQRGKDAVESLPSALDEAVIETIAEDQDDENCDDVKKAVERNYKKKKGADEGLEDEEPRREWVEGAGGEQASSSAAPAWRAPGSTWAENADNNPTKEFAELLLPGLPGVTVRRDESFYTRWIVKYPGRTQATYTKSWNNDAVSPMDALKLVLEEVWAEHFEVQGEGPHFVIGRLPTIVASSTLTESGADDADEQGEDSSDSSDGSEA